MNHAGLSLVEALVATVLLSLVLGVVFAVVDPIHGRMQAQPEAADAQQRLRVAVDAVASALRNAGAGSLVGAARGPLMRALPPVLPYRIGENRPDAAVDVRYRRDAVSIISTPRTAAQATLREAAARGATFLTLSWPASCPPETATTVCGFGEGTRALILDGRGRWDLFTITAAFGTTLEIDRAGGLSYDFAPGAVVTEVRVRVFGISMGATGVPQLMQYDGFQSELPLVDHVVALDLEYFGEPEAPRRLEAAALDAPFGPWTTYGPRPPPLDQDDPADSWPMGENCLFVSDGSRHVPRLPDLSANRELVPLAGTMLTDGPWCPDPGSVDRYDADLLRIRRVAVRVRVQVASDALRGASGALFTRGGTSSTAERYVPDLEVAIDVAPPNLAAGR